MPLPLPPLVEATMNTRGAGLWKGRPVAAAVATIPAGSVAAQSVRVKCWIARSKLSIALSGPKDASLAFAGCGGCCISSGD